MAIEFERKFLVSEMPDVDDCPSAMIKQGYLATTDDMVLRVRVKADQAFLTIKQASAGVGRFEYEYNIPLGDANEMLDRIDAANVISKIRYDIALGAHVWEVDKFDGVNSGLIVAEIELKTEDENFVKPPWLGKEVTHERRYYNAQLSKKPFSKW